MAEFCTEGNGLAGPTKCRELLCQLRQCAISSKKGTALPSYLVRFFTLFEAFFWRSREKSLLPRHICVCLSVCLTVCLSETQNLQPLGELICLHVQIKRGEGRVPTLDGDKSVLRKLWGFSLRYCAMFNICRIY